MALFLTIPDPVATDCVESSLLKIVLDLCDVKGGNLKSY